MFAVNFLQNLGEKTLAQTLQELEMDVYKMD